MRENYDKLTPKNRIKMALEEKIILTLPKIKEETKLSDGVTRKYLKKLLEEELVVLRRVGNVQNSKYYMLKEL